MFRFYPHGEFISVAAHRMDQRFPGASGPEQFRGLDTMLIGILLKVNVVEEARDTPKILFLPIA
jgi:hypothetical protein